MNNENWEMKDKVMKMIKLALKVVNKSILDVEVTEDGNFLFTNKSTDEKVLITPSEIKQIYDEL